VSPAIEVDALTIRYGDTTAVDALSFVVEPGTIVALLGPNGAGKTSTVETLEGFRRPDGGRVRVLGLDPVADHAALTARVGVMLQDGGVYTAAKPLEVLRLFAAYYDDPADPEDLLRQVGLDDQRATSFRNLSGGEQQRLSLALALVGRPELVFLDEPTAGIDPGGRQLIRTTIADLRARGITVLLTTHDLDEAEKLADTVVIIDHGQVLAAGSPAELMQADGSDDIRFGAPPRLDTAGLAAAIGAPVTEVSPGEYVAALAPTPTAVAALTAGLAEQDLPLSDVRAGRQRLEDVFLRLTEAATAAGPAADPTRRRGPRGRRDARRAR
jgi:ABC-2 type transport system ATP-binding protein